MTFIQFQTESKRFSPRPPPFTMPSHSKMPAIILLLKKNSKELESQSFQNHFPPFKNVKGVYLGKTKLGLSSGKIEVCETAITEAIHSFCWKPALDGHLGPRHRLAQLGTFRARGLLRDRKYRILKHTKVSAFLICVSNRST